MPSSLVCSEDSSCLSEQLHIKAQGSKGNNAEKHDDWWAALIFFLVWAARCVAVWASLLLLSKVLSPATAALASCTESPPSLDSLAWADLLLPATLVYFFDLKTPGSAGSDAAHQIYRPITHTIWEKIQEWHGS